MQNSIEFISTSPSSGKILFTGTYDSEALIQQKLKKAQIAQKHWETVSIEQRKEIFIRFSELVKEYAPEAAQIISEENGKPLWEAKMEVNSLVNKVQVVFDAYSERARVKLKELSGGRLSYTRFKPHGVLAVLGPFNFPMSMPNSHIMPALYAGNAVIFKPSERTPASAQYYYDLWVKAGLPNDVLQIVHGDATVSDELIGHEEINGVLFIGSHAAGKEIEKKMTASNKICALEMGGNSPLVIWDYSDIRAAVNIAIQSGFVSSGQRCSAARRLIVNSDIYDEYISALRNATEDIVVGYSDQQDPEPFMGPLIDSRATDNFLKDYTELLGLGAKVIVPTKQITELGYNFVRPSLLDVTDIDAPDKEVFGPLLQITRVTSFDVAICQANKTAYGLAAGVLTEDENLYKTFFDNVNAGIINLNQPLTGSTTINPFGGIKGSGNYRPAGFLSVDYCLYAVASIEASRAQCPAKLSPGLRF